MKISKRRKIIFIVLFSLAACCIVWSAGHIEGAEWRTKRLLTTRCTNLTIEKTYNDGSVTVRGRFHKEPCFLKAKKLNEI